MKAETDLISTQNPCGSEIQADAILLQIKHIPVPV